MGKWNDVLQRLVQLLFPFDNKLMGSIIQTDAIRPFHWRGYYR
jgi:hypothetical protein